MKAVVDKGKGVKHYKQIRFLENNIAKKGKTKQNKNPEG